MATLRTTIGATAVAMAVALAACGGDDGNSTIEADPDDTTTTAVADETTTTAPDEFDQFATATSLVDVPDDLPDGQYFGFITTLIAGDDGISGQFDLAELLLGAAAREASGLDGSEASDDFFIKNENEKLRPILVDPEAIVHDVDYEDCCEPKPSTPAQFVADRDAAGEATTAVSIVIEDGTVTRIDEIYFP